MNILDEDITAQRKKIYDEDTKNLHNLHKEELSSLKQISVDFEVLRTLNVKRLEMLTLTRGSDGIY